MNKELNLVEILKDCPKGTKLYSPIFGDVEFVGILNTGRCLMINVMAFPNTPKVFYSDGRYNTYYSDSEVTLFPSKDNRDWSTFRIPFNEGDFIYTECNQGNEWISIYKCRSKADLLITYADFCKGAESLYINEKNGLCNDRDIKYQRLASDAEIEQLINALHTKGYKWNAEAKKFEKLEADKPKWNPDTLQPFDKVLVRDNPEYEWKGNFFLYKNGTSTNYPYTCICSEFRHCIPYNDETKQMLGTSDEEPEYYRL